MKRIIAILIPLFVCAGAGAQDFIGELATLVKGSRVSCDYTYRTVSGTVLTGTGNAVLQGDCYCLKGNGLEIISDGKTRWTVDPAGKEVYVEAATEFNKIISDIESFLRGIPDLKYENGVMTGTVQVPGEDFALFCTISNVRRESGKGGKEFSFDTAGLDASWVITDLR